MRLHSTEYMRLIDLGLGRLFFFDALVCSFLLLIDHQQCKKAMENPPPPSQAKTSPKIAKGGRNISVSSPRVISEHTGVECTISFVIYQTSEQERQDGGRRRKRKNNVLC